MVLDPDDPRSPYEQVANHLRAAILTGDFKAGDRLPSGAKLSETYGVARMTINKAIDVLRDENLVISRQGSGVFVRERTTKPIGLRPHIEAAFEAKNVTIDFAGFSGETLHGALTEPLDKIRGGRYTPETIRIRAIVPDTSMPWSVPSNVADLSDNPAFRARAQGIIDRHAGEMIKAVEELESLGLVPSASAEVRTVGEVQLFKLYLINNAETFFGFYPIHEWSVDLDGDNAEMFDLMGKDATLFHTQATNSPNDSDSQYVDQARQWFESVWETVAHSST